LLADTGFVLPPDLDRFARSFRWDRGAHEVGEVLLECFLCRRIGFGMLWAHRETAVVVLIQQLADRPLVQRHVELTQDAIPQVDTPPTHHAVLRQIGTSLDPSDQLLLLCFPQRRVPPRSLPIAQPVNTAVVVAVHPVPQRLAVHTCCSCGFFTRGAVQHEGNRQRSAHRARILHPSRTHTQFRCRHIRPSDRHRHHCQPRESTPASIESQIAPAENPPPGVNLRGRWYERSTGSAMAS